MAEFERGYCTGCGYKVKRWGHRPYCWRVVCHQLAYVDPVIKTVVLRCLRKMQQHHRVLSFFLSRREHMYYTVQSIETAENAPAQHSAPTIHRLEDVLNETPEQQEQDGE